MQHLHRQTTGNKLISWFFSTLLVVVLVVALFKKLVFRFSLQEEKKNWENEQEKKNKQKSRFSSQQSCHIWYVFDKNSSYPGLKTIKMIKDSSFSSFSSSPSSTSSTPSPSPSSRFQFTLQQNKIKKNWRKKQSKTEKTQPLHTNWFKYLINFMR